MNKWIKEAENENTCENEFLNLKNVQINTEYYNLKLKNELNDICTIKSGKIDELAVEINWMEIFRYWTEIQAKYHNFDDCGGVNQDDYIYYNENTESANDYNNNNNNSVNNSLIKIKNCTIELELNVNEDDIMTICDEFGNDLEEFTHDIFNELLESPEIIDVDLMADFIKHIIGQFKIEIEGISVKITNQNNVQWKLFVPRLLIHPESNGIRRIIVIDEDVKVFGAEFDLKVQKGFEIQILRTIKSLKIKVKIPGIDFKTDCRDFESLYSLWTEFLSPKSLSKKQKANNSKFVFFEFIIDVFKIKISSLRLLAHDLMMMGETGNFIMGHFQVRLDEDLILDSPVQTHCITGNFKTTEFFVIVEELLRIKVDFQQIKDLINFFTFKSEFENKRKQPQNSEFFTINIRSLQLLLKNFLQLNFEYLCLRPNCLSLNLVQVKCIHSEIILQNISYSKSEVDISTRVAYKSPFSDLIRYIENDQIISLKDRKELYTHYETYLDRLEIQNLTGEIHFKDMETIYEALNFQNAKFGESSPAIELTSKIENIKLKFNLDNSNNYFIALKRLDILKTNQIIDFRCESLESFERNSISIIKSKQISLILAEGLDVMDVESIVCTIPHDLHQLIKNDLNVFDYKKILGFDSLEMTSKKLNHIQIQLTLRNIKLSLLPPPERSNDLQIESHVIIKEINFKLTEDFVAYLDEGELILTDESILRSGLLKFNRSGSEVQFKFIDLYYL